MTILVAEIDARKVTAGLDGLRVAMDRNLRIAMAQSATEVADRAKEIVDADTNPDPSVRSKLGQPSPGRLRSSILAGQVQGTLADDSLQVDVRAGGEGVNYARYVEEGTRAHPIYPKGAREGRGNPHLRWVGASGDFVFRKRVLKHPGTTGIHFMARATEEKTDRFQELFGAALELAIDEAFG